MLKKFVLYTTILFFIVFSHPIFAQEINSGGFQVYSVTPNDQIDKLSSFFYVPSDPGEIKTFQVTLENSSSNEKIIIIEKNNSLSSPLVNLQYLEKEETFFSYSIDKNFLLKNHIQIKDEVLLKPFEKKTISFTVTTPPGITEGKVLGAISFQEKNQEQKQSKETKSMNVKIHKKYTIAILLQLSDSIEQKVVLKDESTIDVKTGEPIIYSIIENQTADIVKGVILTYKVKKEGNDDYIIQEKLNLNAMSPMTTLKQPIEWKKGDFEEGNYVIELMLSNSKDEVLDESKSIITVKKEDVKELIQRSDETNKDNIVIVQKPFSKWVWLSILILVSLSIFNFLIWKKRSKEKVNNDNS